MRHLALAAITATVLAACTRTVYVPVQSIAVRTDTVYRAAVRADTVGMVVERVIERTAAGDTMRVIETRDRWRTRDRVDTVCRFRTDTVTIAVPPSPAAHAATPWYSRAWVWFAVSLALGALLLKRYIRP